MHAVYRPAHTSRIHVYYIILTNLLFLLSDKVRTIQYQGRGCMVFLPNQMIFFLPTRKKIISDQKQTIFFLRYQRQTFFFQDMFKDPFHCETGKRGTFTCRHTVAYRLTHQYQQQNLLQDILKRDIAPMLF